MARVYTIHCDKCAAPMEDDGCMTEIGGHEFDLCDDCIRDLVSIIEVGGEAPTAPAPIDPSIDSTLRTLVADTLTAWFAAASSALV